MEIEPVGRSSQRGTWRTVALLASPLVAVAIVVATALGGDGSWQEERGSSGPALVASPHIASAPPGPDADAVGAAPPDPGFPDEVFGLATRGVAAVRDEHRREEIGGRLVAVAGYLTIRPELERCLESVTAAQLPSVRCVRQTLLTDDPEPMLGWADDDTVVRVGPRGRAHLHGTVFPGVSMAAAEAYLATEPPPMGGGSALGQGYFLVPPVPVVAIGRFDDPRLTDTARSDRHPGEAFTIERIAWVAGSVQRTPIVQLVDDRAPADTAAAEALATLRGVAAEALPSEAVVLGLTILEPDALATVHPFIATATGLTRDSSASRVADGAVWYARAALVSGRRAGSAGTSGDQGPELAWAVVDGQGNLLGTGVGD